MELDSTRGPAEPPTPSRRHALATLRHRDFRLLWIGQLIAMIGLVMQEITVSWHMYLLTDSPLQVGLLALFRLAPVLVLALVGGATADLGHRKSVLVVTQLLLIGAAGTLFITTSLGVVTPWVLFGVTLLTGVALAFDLPARNALLPNTVPRDELSNALTLQSLVRQTATVVGPGVGGVIIGQLGLSATYATAGVCFLALMLALWAMGPVPATRSDSVGGWETMLGGLRYARTEPLILFVFVLDFMVVAFVQTLTLIPIFARDVLVVGPQGLGLLAASSAAGAMVGAVALGALGGVARPIPVMLAMLAARGLFVAFFGQAPDFGLALLMLFCVGVADVVSEVMGQTVIQLKTPDEVRGRVQAFGMLFTFGGPYLGQFQSGVVASVVGARAAATIGGCAALVVVAVFSQLREMRRATAELRAK